METDFKKKYEEALNLAKSYYGKGQNEFLDTLFPELRESDDERIRTFLYHTFTAQYLCKDKTGKWHGEPVTNILAYLERQKEQEPAEWRDDDQKMLDKIVNIVIYAADTCRIINDDDVIKIESWIKKQVYANWKPTAEQLEAFELAVKWYSDNLGANPKLYDLEEDLNRL